MATFTASCDSAEVNARFAKSLDLNYPILSDPEKTTARAYGVVTNNRPVPFRWTFYIGLDGKILHIDKLVKARSHGTDVAVQLKELGVPKKDGAKKDGAKKDAAKKDSAKKETGKP